MIYVAGSFDIIHLGHIEFLQKAKEMGTFLIAGIHDDEVFIIIIKDNILI